MGRRILEIFLIVILGLLAATIGAYFGVLLIFLGGVQFLSLLIIIPVLVLIIYWVTSFIYK